MNSLNRDFLSNETLVAALTSTLATAGGAGDATAANGTSIDMLSYASFESVAFLVHCTASLTAAQTLSMPVKIQTSSDDSSWSDVETTTYDDTQATLSMSASGQSVVSVQCPREYLERYVRVVATPNLSHTGTDTARFNVIAVLHGLQRRSAA